MNSQIFREYDIRGLVGKDLNEEVVEAIGRGFGTYLQKKSGKKVIIGRDNRLSSEKFSNALKEGILSTGCDILDVGLVPTPVFYFSIINLNGDGGMMVTGSHNPPDFNGFKVCVGKTTIYGEEIQNLRKLIEKGEFIKSKRGEVKNVNTIQEYIKFIKDRIKIQNKLKVVLDGGNGTSGLIAPDLIRDLGCEVIELYCNLDGNFPNHFPDPTVPANVEDLIKKVIEEKADLGIAYDGDADRIGVIDDEGKIIFGDQLMILFAKDVLSNIKGAKVICDVKSSQTLVDAIKNYGGEPVMYKTGHSLIKMKMKEIGAPLAGEMSGHIFFSDKYLGYDDAIFASCRLLEILSKEGRKISDIYKEIPKMYSTPEIRLDCPDDKKFKIVNELQKHFKQKYDVIDIDGARILFNDGWGLIRASNTQPVIVLRFEANTEEALESIKNEITNKLKELL